MSGSETRYTLYRRKPGFEHDDEVIARGLSVAEVSKTVREFDGHAAWYAFRDYGDFRALELSKFDGKGKLKLAISATVPLTSDEGADRLKAEMMIDTQVVARHREFLDCHVDTDTKYDARVRRIAEARAVRDLDRRIVTTLIDKLLEEGYRITACARFDNPPFRNSRRRDAILKLLFDLELADLLVHKDGETSWISLMFDEAGWDVIADWSEDLTPLIKPLYEPHLPWNQPGREHERGYTIISLPSPNELASGNPDAIHKVQGFFDTFDLG